MTTVHATRPLYASITTRLVTTGKAVGQAVRPDGATPPYMVLYPREDLATEGGLGDPNEIRVVQFQVTSVGDTLEEADWMRHKAQVALLGFSPTGGGPILLEFAANVLRDDEGPVFSFPDRFITFVS